MLLNVLVLDGEIEKVCLIPTVFRKIEQDLTMELDTLVWNVDVGL